MKILLSLVLAVATAVFSSSALSNESSVEECAFTTAPRAVCSISIYKLIAVPEKFDNKYISVMGYMGIDNGRLAVYPSRDSYIMGISQESFSITSEYPRRIELSKMFSGHVVRVVGKFTYKIVGDEPGIGYIRDIAKIFKVEPRGSRQEDQEVGGTAEEISRWARQAVGQGGE